MKGELKMPGRKRYESSDKVGIIRRHLLEGEPVSKLCEEVGIKPTQFYQWQKEFFENGSVVFERKGGGSRRRESALEAKVQKLESKLAKKDEVLSELMEEYVSVKKSLGEA
jgi:transposase-like protein